MKRTLSSTSAIAIAIALASGPAAGKTLEEAVAKIMSTNPEIGAIRKNRRAIDQELRAARGLYFPQVDLRGAYGPEWSDNSSTRGRGKSGMVHMQRMEMGVVVQQRVFDGFFTDNEVKRQIGRVNSARFRVYDTAESVGLRGVESYLDVLRTARIVILSKANLKAHEEILARVTARAKGGRGPQSDVTQAQARMYNAKSDLAQSRGRYQDAVARYRAVVGERPEKLQDINAPELELPPNVDEAVSTAIKTAPSIKAAEADITTAKGQVGVAKSNFFPSVNIEAGYNWNRNIDGVRGNSNDAQVLAVGRWNIYRGGVDTARRREAGQRLAEARDTLDLARREVAQQVRLSWAALNAARERRVALQNQSAATAKTRDAYDKQFNLGQRTLLDLLDIQNELFTTRTTLVTEDFTVKFGVYRTLATMGLLLKTLGVPKPKEYNRKPNNFRNLDRKF